jgi:hypothetical protein
LAQEQPANTQWKYELARLHQIRQDRAQAERWYRAVLEEDPHNPEALEALADLLAQPG